MESRDKALQRAIDKAGGPIALARYISAKQGRITAQAVCGWMRCPPARAIIVERASGVPRHLLRPDIFPRPRKEATA